MAEGIQAYASKKKLPLVVAGTVGVLLVAGVLVQVLRPTSAFPAANDTAGKASLKEQQPAAPAKRYVGRVGKQLIGYDELADECVAETGKEVLDSMINRLIIQQACEARGIEVSQTEVNEEIVRIAKKFGIAVDQWLQMLQAERNVTPAKYRRDIIWPMLALKKLAGTQVAITETDLQKAFIRNYGERVKARAIVLDNSRRATEVWEKLAKAPAAERKDEFGRLAKEYSMDPNSRALEGAIPPIRRFGGSEVLEEQAFKLKPGEISGVVQIDVSQYIILFCEGRTEPIVKNRGEVEDILKQELQEENSQKQVADVFQKIKEEARVDNYLTGISTGGDKKAAAGTAPGATTPAASKTQQIGGAVAPSAAKKVVPATGTAPAGAAPPRQLPPQTKATAAPTPGRPTTSR